MSSLEFSEDTDVLTTGVEGDSNQPPSHACSSSVNLSGGGGVVVADAGVGGSVGRRQLHLCGEERVRQSEPHLLAGCRR